MLQAMQLLDASMFFTCLVDSEFIPAGKEKNANWISQDFVFKNACQ